MPKQPTDKDAAEAAIIQRIDRVMACFISEESGMTAIPAEEVINWSILIFFDAVLHIERWNRPYSSNASPTPP